MIYIVLYLAAAVLANLMVTWFGASSAPFVAFGLVSFDLTSRDRLHDAWKNQGLWWKMALLIGGGSVLSWLVNRQAGPIALASFVAFGLSGLSDAVTYAVLGKRAYLVRVNGSNVASAGVDSVVFLTLAFGWPPAWGLVILQFLAKLVGGLLWSVVLKEQTRKKSDENRSQVAEQETLAYLSPVEGLAGDAGGRVHAGRAEGVRTQERAEA